MSTYKTRSCRFCGRPGATFVPELGKGHAHLLCWNAYSGALAKNTDLTLPEARAAFAQWLAEPRRHEALSALCLVSRLERADYFIRKPELDAPWCLVHAGRIVGVEPGQAPHAVLATGRRARVVVEPLPIFYCPGDANIHAYMADGSVWEVMPSGKPYMVRAPHAYRVALDSKERAA